jgi:hypothetical protein
MIEVGQRLESSGGRHGTESLSTVDSVYYRDAGQFKTARGISARARTAMYQLFMREMRPTPAAKVLDFGVSDEEGPETNMLEKQYPWPEKITCAGLGTGQALLATYPRVSYVRVAASGRLPFGDKTFDIVWCNAVLEHVGGRDNRADLFAEFLRVSHSSFLTVPNRWFPIEHHTAIPLLHWSAKLFRATLRNTRLSYWSNSENLEFLSKKSLLQDWPAARVPSLHYTGLYLGPFSSNIALTYRSS